MDKETIALIIAQNGLRAASTILSAKSAKLEKQLAKAKDKQEQAKLTKDANKAKKLAAALLAADEGITAYLRETA
ncbi:MAG: hypothetical protein AB7P14_21500 [Blastocatellales bacterium]